MRVRIILLILVAIQLGPIAGADDRGPGGKELVADRVIEMLLDRINQDRSRHGLDPVRYDPSLSQIAGRRCLEQLREGTRGHFATNGVAPYVRYARAGEYDLVNENVASWSTRVEIPYSAVEEMARQSHNEMLMELPPEDGHRRAILDPWATHVGIGIAWSGGELRMIEAFRRDFLQLTDSPHFVDVHSSARLSGTIEANARLVEATVHWEPLPRPISSRRADSATMYAYPKPMRRIQARAERVRSDGSLAGAARRLDRDTLEVQDRDFVMSTVFDRGPGIYTFVFHVRPKEGAQAIPVANVSITAVRSDLEGEISRLGL